MRGRAGDVEIAQAYHRDALDAQEPLWMSANTASGGIFPSAKVVLPQKLS